MQSGLYTDLYELTMVQGYFLMGRKAERAVFDYFFRNCPFGGSFVLFAGLEDLLKTLVNLSFSEKDIDYLRKEGFEEAFLDYLEHFRFKGSIVSVMEGEVVFPNEPILRVEGNLIETQLIETLLLNFLNFQSLIATKAARIRLAAGNRLLADFGLRRAQGLGGIHASRAAIIGGVNSTSNVYAGRHFDLPVTGTMAHSWILGFDDELTAFRAFAALYPDNCIFLVDTYNTLDSGIPNAITVGRELAKEGHRLKGIRLDSGNLAELAQRARVMLDEAGFEDAKVMASDNLDEFAIEQLLREGAPIDGFGVGTQMITGRPTAALNGVYKLCYLNGTSRLKISENVAKTTLPGIKKLLRYRDQDGFFQRDEVLLKEERAKGEELLQTVMKNGSIITPLRSPAEIQNFARERLSMLRAKYKESRTVAIYPVEISDTLQQLKAGMIAEF